MKIQIETIKKNNYTISEAEESTQLRLYRLAKTASDRCRPINRDEELYFLGDYSPYEGMDAIKAYIDFKRLLATYLASTRTPSTYFSSMRRESSISVTSVGVKLTEAVDQTSTAGHFIPINNGCIQGKMTDEEMMVRDFATVVTLHTSSETKKESKEPVVSQILLRIVD